MEQIYPKKKRNPAEYKCWKVEYHYYYGVVNPMHVMTKYYWTKFGAKLDCWRVSNSYYNVEAAYLYDLRVPTL